MPLRKDIGTEKGVEDQRLVYFARTATFADQARTVIQQVQSSQLPAELAPWVARYEQVGLRTPFIWKWIVRGMDATMLSSVTPSLGTAVRAVKFLGAMVAILLDDIADVRQDSQMLESALDIVVGRSKPEEWGRFVPEGAQYLQCIADVWSEVMLRARALPRYAELSDILAYDYSQLFNTMRYALLLNRHTELLNLTENELYQPHNMHMMVNWTMDLMASPSFELSELGLFREVAIRGQRMGRIGNQVSTWERELKDVDCSSAVFGYALCEGLITYDQIRRWDKDEISRTFLAMDVEAFFLRQWQRLHDEILMFADRIQSVDVLRVIAGLEELIRLHLGSKGLK